MDKNYESRQFDEGEMKRLLQEYENKNRELNEMLNTIPGGICKVRLDNDFTLLYGNAGYYELYGYTREEMRYEIGNRLIALIDDQHAGKVMTSIQRAYQERQKGFEIEKRVFRRNGEPVWLLTVGVFREEADEVHLYCMVFDITEKKQSEDKQKRSREQLKILAKQTQSTVFEFDFGSKQLVLSREVEEEYGIPAGTADVPAYLIEAGIIHKDGVKDFLRMQEQIAKGAAESVCVIEMKAVGTGYRWKRVHLIRMEKTGQVPRVMGIIQDITDQKEAEFNSIKTETYKDAILADSEGYSEVNVTQDRVEKVSGVRSKYILSDQDSYSVYVWRIVEAEVHVDDKEMYLKTFSPENFKKWYQEGKYSIYMEYRQTGEQNRIRWMAVTGCLVQDPVTKDIKAVIYVKDIDQAKKKSLEWKNQAERDPYTGLYNRTVMQHLIDEYLSTKEKGEICGFFLLRLNGLDQQEEKERGILLKESVSRIKEKFRIYDYVGRLKKDLLVVFMKNCKISGIAEQKAVSLCQVFAEQLPPLTCSLAVLEMAAAASSYQQLYGKASSILKGIPVTEESQYRFWREEDVPDYAEGGEEELQEDTMGYTWESELSGILDDMEDVVYLSDPKTHELIYINKRALENLGYTGSEYIGEKCYRILQGKEAPCAFCTNAYLEKDKTYVWNHTNEILKRSFIIKDKLVEVNGKILRMEIATDVTELEEIRQEESVEKNLSELEQKLSLAEAEGEILQRTGEAILKYYRAERACILKYQAETGYCLPCMQVDAAGVVREEIQNDRYLLEQLIGNREKLCYPDLEEFRFTNLELYRCLKKRQVKALYGTAAESREAGRYFVLVINPERNEDHPAFMELAAGGMLSRLESCRLKQQIYAMTWQDGLTGLSNRSRYNEYIQKLKTTGLQSLGIGMIHVGGLRRLNTAYGNTYGDQVLRESAAVILQFFGKDQAFRLGGTEFVVAAENMSQEEWSSRVSRLKQELLNGGTEEIFLGACWSDLDMKLEEMLEQAEELMDVEKYRYYQQQNRITKSYRPDLLQKLRKEMKDGRYCIYLQPKVDMHTGEIVGAESLIRRYHVDGQVETPDKFLPVIEKEHLIRFVDLFVFEEVLRLLKRWKEEGRELIPIALNFSRITLLEKDLVPMLCDLVERYQVDPRYIEIEITETVGEMEKTVLHQMSEMLKEKGFKIALDDFGTKYTNLSVLVSMRFDVLKLDRSLVNSISVSDKNKVVIQTILNMCRELRVETVAEGVETEEQKEMLDQMGCTYGQGYLFSKPVSIQAFEELQRK